MCHITFGGAPAGILALSEEGSKGKKPAVSVEARAEHIGLVAGAGFEPATFRL